MPGNKGCAACQRGNTGNNLTSKRAAPAVCSRLGELGWRITAAQTKQRESCRPLALLIYQISNLTCSFSEFPPPEKKDVGFKVLWRDIFGSCGHMQQYQIWSQKWHRLARALLDCLPLSLLNPSQITSSIRSTQLASCNRDVKMFPSGKDKATNPFAHKRYRIPTWCWRINIAYRI